MGGQRDPQAPKGATARWEETGTGTLLTRWQNRQILFLLHVHGYTIADVVENVLNGLDAPYPEIPSKRLQGKSERQIAQEIGSTRETVRYKLKRIRERLRAMLGEAEA